MLARYSKLWHHLGLLAILLVGTAPALAEVNTQAIYQRFSHAYQHLDTQVLQAQYHPAAMMLGVSEKQPFIDDAQGILGVYKHWFDKVKQRNGKIQIRFRGTKRVQQDNVLIEAGYYQVYYLPASEEEEPTRFSGKYVFTLTQDEQGQWRILADCASRVKAELFDQSQPVAGLVYDAAFDTKKQITP